jgi:hypothetical protein
VFCCLLQVSTIAVSCELQGQRAGHANQLHSSEVPWSRKTTVSTEARFHEVGYFRNTPKRTPAPPELTQRVGLGTNHLANIPHTLEGQRSLPSLQSPTKEMGEPWIYLIQFYSVKAKAVQRPSSFMSLMDSTCETLKRN